MTVLGKMVATYIHVGVHTLNPCIDDNNFCITVLCKHTS